MEELDMLDAWYEFEEYLVSQKLYDEYEELPETSQHPDYVVTSGDTDYLFEVKDFEYKGIPEAGAYDPYKQIRTKIHKAKGKFKNYKDSICSLVLYNNGASLVDLETPHVLYGSMYGNIGVSFPIHVDNPPVTQVFMDGGKMTRLRSAKPMNTTISAIITLRYVCVGRGKSAQSADKKKRDERLG